MPISDDTLSDWDDQAGKIGEHLPDIPIDSIRVDNYYISSLVNYFANLTRYGTNLKPVSHVSILDGQDYIEVLAMYAAMAGVVASGLTIFLLIFCCCNCMFRSAAPRTPKKKNNKSRSSCICGMVIMKISVK